MIELVPTPSQLDILCLGSHPDDIEIGCGGTLLALAERPQTTLTAVVLTGKGRRKEEAENALPQFFPGATVEVLGLPDGRLPAHWGEAKDALEGFALAHQPSIIFAPSAEDAHQDHRVLGQLVSTVWRDSLILRYEIPKWDGDMVRPTHYVRIGIEQAHRKVELLNECYPSQGSRDWWDDDLFLGLMRIRGVECRAPYAEAYCATKMVLDLCWREPRD